MLDIFQERYLGFDMPPETKAAEVDSKPSPLGLIVAERVQSILDSKELTKESLVEGFEQWLDRKPAQQQVDRILQAKGNPSPKTIKRIAKILGVKEADIAPTKGAADANSAVVLSLVTAPVATEDELLADFKSLLSNRDAAPYIRMATKILATLNQR